MTTKTITPPISSVAELTDRSGLQSVDAACVNILGIGVHAVDMDLAISTMQAAIEDGQRGYVCLTSAHGIVEAQGDPGLKTVMARALLVLPDGMPMVWMGHLQGHTKMGRVFGPDLMQEILRREDLSHLRHFLCGGDPGVAGQLREEMQRRYPWVRIVGTFTPPFREMTGEEEQVLAEQVRRARPDIVWVGIGTPKQEHFMVRYLPKLETTLMVGVGAAFLYHTGALQDSPAWIKRCGLQWLHRLLQEPARLWRRYLFVVPFFLFHAALQISGLRRYPLYPLDEGASAPATAPAASR